jgi:hypothetical protein
MDSILEHTFRLGCALRDSQEGRIWRESREALSKIPLNTPNLAVLPPEKVSIVENLGLIHRANKARPLMLPLLVSKYTPRLNHDEIRRELNKNSEIWKSYRQLELCTAFTGIVVTFLRSIAPGYPHPYLVYSLPNTIWSQLSSYKELPWNMASSVIPKNASEVQQLGLERVIPVSAPIIVKLLDSLAKAIKSSEGWMRLSYTCKAIEKHRNLKEELQRAQQEYRQKVEIYRNPNVSKPTAYEKAHNLAEEVYSKRGKRIQNYVESFLDYERLVECIYWVLSQLISFEQVSCVTSSNPQQLQQIFLSYGKKAYMTAVGQTVGQTRGKTLAVGQLIHVTLPETDRIADGLYQINLLRQKYDPESGAHVFFRAQCIWYCRLEDLAGVVEKYNQPTFLQNENSNLVEGTTIVILEGETPVESFEVGEFLRYQFSDAMYLP